MFTYTWFFTLFFYLVYEFWISLNCFTIPKVLTKNNIFRGNRKSIDLFVDFYRLPSNVYSKYYETEVTNYNIISMTEKPKGKNCRVFLVRFDWVIPRLSLLSMRSACTYSTILSVVPTASHRRCICVPCGVVVGRVFLTWVTRSRAVFCPARYVPTYGTRHRVTVAATAKRFSFGRAHGENTVNSP